MRSTNGALIDSPSLVPRTAASRARPPERMPRKYLSACPPGFDAGIAYVKGQRDLSILRRAAIHAQFSMPLIGEFQRISCQIEQNLLQTSWIPNRGGRHRRANCRAQLHSFFLCLRGQYRARICQHLSRRKGIAPTSTSRLRFSRDRECRSVLAANPFTPDSRSNRTMPRIPCIVVRISWVMFARNWLLAWFAASANFFADPNSRLTKTSRSRSINCFQ